MLFSNQLKGKYYLNIIINECLNGGVSLKKFQSFSVDVNLVSERSYQEYQVWRARFRGGFTVYFTVLLIYSSTGERVAVEVKHRSRSTRQQVISKLYFIFIFYIFINFYFTL